MNACTKLTGFLLATLIGTSCGGSSSQTVDALETSPVVGQYVQVGDNKVFTAEQQLLTDTVRMPLSFFAKEMEIVKLDNRDEALVGTCGATISDNYILVHSGYPPTAFKLFDRKGTYIANVGSAGDGPDEYKSVYDAQIDEQNQRIYLAPYQSNKLLVFDLNGKVLEPIPFGVRCPKAKFKVDPVTGIITVATLPWPEISAFLWTQDMTGKRIQEVASSNLTVLPNLNTEVFNFSNVEGVFDFSLYSMLPTRVDSLYRYNTERNQLQPVFTFNHAITDPVPWHGYGEWPDYFVGNFSGPPVIQKHEKGSTYTPGETLHYIIDKKTGKGAYFKLYNDYFGNLEINYSSYAFSKGYFIKNIEPGNLLNDIEIALKNQDITDAMRKKLTDLQNSIDENDNNYVMIARLKK